MDLKTNFAIPCLGSTSMSSAYRDQIDSIRQAYPDSPIGKMLYYEELLVKLQALGYRLKDRDLKNKNSGICSAGTVIIDKEGRISSYKNCYWELFRVFSAFEHRTMLDIAKANNTLNEFYDRFKTKTFIRSSLYPYTAKNVRSRLRFYETIEHLTFNDFYESPLETEPYVEVVDTNSIIQAIEEANKVKLYDIIDSNLSPNTPVVVLNILPEGKMLVTGDKDLVNLEIEEREPYLISNGVEDVCILTSDEYSIPKKKVRISLIEIAEKFGLSPEIIEVV